MSIRTTESRVKLTTNFFLCLLIKSTNGAPITNLFGVVPVVFPGFIEVNAESEFVVASSDDVRLSRSKMEPLMIRGNKRVREKKSA